MKNYSNFVGRKAELAQLGRFFTNTQGGAILIAGDRGSGKTTLVENSLQSLHEIESWYERYIRFFRQKRIIVRIPLIIQDDIDQSPITFYRSMLMRAIARGLEQDLLSRRWSRFDLPNRWFRSIGYIQEIQRVLPFAKYTSIKKASTAKMDLSKSGLVAGLNNLTSAELEINDTVLEIALRHLLTNHKDNHDFIFIVDELDKLTNQKAKFAVEDMAMLLKNLFSETGVHVVFISDEPSLGRITEKIRNNPFCAEHTLFRNTILLNQMKPDDFEEMILPLIGPAGLNDRRKHVASLSLLTKMMPSEVQRLQLRAGINIDDIVTAQKNAMGTFEYSYSSTMQLLINHIYSDYCGRHDQYYDRILFKALNNAGNNLLNNRVRRVEWEKWDGLLYTSDLFRSPDEELSAKSKGEYSGITSIPEIITQIEQLNSDAQASIKTAIGHLFVILDRLGYLNLTLADATSIQILFIGDTFTIENLPSDIESYKIPREAETTVRSRINLIGHIYLKAVGTALWTNIWPFPLQIPDLHEGRGVTHITENALMSRTLSCFWKNVENILERSAEHITESTVSRLSSAIGLPRRASVVRVDDYCIEVSKVQPGFDEKIKVIIFVGQTIEQDFESYKKVFILQDAHNKYDSKRNSRVKKYTLKPEWRDYSEIISEIANFTKTSLEM